MLKRDLASVQRYDLQLHLAPAPACQYLNWLTLLHLCLQGVSLALSLHAPTQELRRTIVPSARAYPLHKLMDAVAEYQSASQQRVFVEYVVLSGVNDGQEQAHELGQLLQVRDRVRGCSASSVAVLWIAVSVSRQ
jgi:hypothetical protein